MPTSRRHFIGATLGAAISSAAQAQSPQNVSPNDRLRSRKPVVEDATFGFRAAGPALLSNVSYFEERVCKWDPEAMKMA